MKYILSLLKKEFYQTSEIINRKKKSLRTVNLLISTFMIFILSLSLISTTNIPLFVLGVSIVSFSVFSLFLIGKNNYKLSTNITVFLVLTGLNIYFIVSYVASDNVKYLIIAILVFVIASLGASFFSLKKFHYLSTLGISTLGIILLPIFVTLKHPEYISIAYILSDLFFIIAGLTTVLVLSAVILKTNEDMSNLIETKESINSELATAKYNISQILKSIDDGFLAVDSKSMLTYVNDSAQKKLGIAVTDNLIGKSIYDVYSEYEYPEIFQSYKQVLWSREPSTFEFFNQHMAKWYTGRVYPSDDGGVTILTTDITERKNMEIELFTSKNNIEQILESISDGFLACDATGCINYINEAALKIWNFPYSDVIIGSGITELFNEHSSIEAYNLYIKVVSEGVPHNCEYYNESICKWLMLRMYPANNEGVSAFLTDITERKEKELSLKARAESDELTAVYNRATCFFILEEQIKLTMMMEHFPLTICYIDLNNLKFVNDNFGHSEGDIYITSVVNAIKKTLRDSDIFGRVGGDEFLLILPNCSEENAKQIMQRAEMEVANLNTSAPKTYTYGVSIGIMEYPKNSNLTAKEFVSEADFKMYHEKKKKFCKI